jgi:alpha,alpha-trehalase
LRHPQLRSLAKRINRLWKELSRKIKDEVRESPQLYSIIYVPNGFVVPGGRFREFYYWDTYWIVKALLRCDMAQTVKGVLENFLLLVQTYGLVPNGGRIYYAKRSQPPFLSLMMKEYMSKTAEVEFLRHHLPTLEKELQFWEKRRSLLVEKDGVDHLMFVYGTGGHGPRPESYREDVELAEEFETEEEREEFYFHMKAGAESGWDYSTRWMIDKKVF